MERIGVLVVHGVGEQTHFEHLEALVSNLYKALCKDPKRKAHLQIRKGDQVPRQSPEESWREVPALVRWCKPEGEWVEARFREVHWADLDMPMTGLRWLGFIVWALGMPGSKFFPKAKEVEALEKLNMCLPKSLPSTKQSLVRAQLFLVSFIFFLMLFTIDLLYGMSFRLFNIQWLTQLLKKLRGVIYDYVSDVKLYQDQFVREDDRLETLGEKSRVAIRRRMVRALVRIAAQVETGELDGYFIFAHSLGTVVAFNALMEHELALPNYLIEEEWESLPAALKKQALSEAPQKQMPHRPPWLKPKDAINRPRVFAGLRGFITMGSPLDKFAALWPAIVPVNGEAVPDAVPWVNVADVQDIVASSIDLFPSYGQAPGIGGLRLTNIDWADRLTLFSAHTSYWKCENPRDRLIDCIIPWLEGGPPRRPADRINRHLARTIYWVSLMLLGIVLLLLASGLVWLLLGLILGVVSFSLALISAVAASGVFVVAVCAFVRSVLDKRGWQ